MAFMSHKTKTIPHKMEVIPHETAAVSHKPRSIPGDMNIVSRGTGFIPHMERWVPHKLWDDGADYDALRSSFSAIHTLMTDCRVTPSRLASRSRDSTIQAGKSTLTRRAS